MSKIIFVCNLSELNSDASEFMGESRVGYLPLLLHLFCREQNEQNAHKEFNTFKFAMIYF